MKLEILNEQTTEEEEPIYLALERSGLEESGISLVVYRKKSDTSPMAYLVTITKNGELVRCRYVNRSLGFPLEGQGKLRLIRE